MPAVRPDYELVIRPRRGWHHLSVADVWRYRDLLFLLVYRDFIAKYKQTILGPAWFILQPLLMTAVFTVIFGGVAKIPTDELPPALFYLTGLLGWNYFAQTLQSTSSTLIANAALFGKIYFPRLLVPLSSVISNFMALTIQLTTLVCVWVYFKMFTSAGQTMTLSVAIILLPLVFVQVAALSLGVGLWLAALTAKYRDFTFLTGFIVQLWMYATPVIYPLSQIPDKWRWVAVLNPMSPLVEIIRYMFLGKGTILYSYLAVSVGMTLILLASGAAVFTKVEKKFVDTV